MILAYTRGSLLAATTFMHTRLRIIALAALLLACSLRGQGAAPLIANRHSGIDLFVGEGSGGWVGSSDVRGGGASSFGIGIQRAVGTRNALRTEVGVRYLNGALGTGSGFTGPAPLSLGRLGVSGQFRRYGANGLFIGGGVLAEKTTSCGVYVEGNFGFFAGETVSCADYTDLPVRSNNLVVSALATTGFEYRRVGLDLRVDQGLSSSVETANGGARSISVSLVGRVLLSGRKASRGSRP